MDVTEDFVRHVAALARLQLSDEEVRAMQPQLARILGHIDQVRQIDVGDHDPATQPAIGVDALRPDIQGQTLDPQAMLRNAPAHDGAFLVVPRFFDEGGEGS